MSFDPISLIGAAIGGIGSLFVGNRAQKQAEEEARRQQESQARQQVLAQRNAPITMLEVPDAGNKANPAAKAMASAKEKEQQAAEARRAGGQTVFTSPLGAVGAASTSKKQILGA